jgi:DNA-binding IclR family transcriptional regulator
VLGVMNAVLEIGFDGCAMEDVSRHTGISYHSVRRALESLSAAEWVEEMKQPGTNQKLWRPGKKLLGISFAYRRHCISKIHTIEQEYTELSGKRLRDEL